MEKNDKDYIINLINEFIAADIQLGVIFWSVLNPAQREEFETKLRTVIAQDEARIAQPSHRTGILKALLKNMEYQRSLQQPAGSVSHLRAVPESESDKT